VEPDAFTWRIGRGKELADGIEDDFELLIVAVFQGTDLADEFLGGKGHLAQADERPHDADIDGYVAGAVEDAEKHGNAFLGERVGQITAPAAAFVWGARLEPQSVGFFASQF